MLTNIKQILQILVILVLTLVIPLGVEVLQSKNNIVKHAEISSESATISNVLGETSANENNDISNIQRKSLSVSLPSFTSKITTVRITHIALYTLGLLFIISILSFIKFRVVKDINEEK